MTCLIGLCVMPDDEHVRIEAAPADRSTGPIAASGSGVGIQSSGLAGRAAGRGAHEKAPPVRLTGLVDRVGRRDRHWDAGAVAWLMIE